VASITEMLLEHMACVKSCKNLDLIFGLKFTISVGNG
jgi:hypothetical protein